MKTGHQRTSSQRALLLAGLCACMGVGFVPQARAAIGNVSIVQQQGKKVTGTVSDS